MPRVLLVSSNITFLKRTHQFLERYSEFIIDACISGEEALESVGTREYDAIISDYNLSGMDCITMLNTIRSRGIDTPFIMFIEERNRDILIKAIDGGAGYFVFKEGNTEAQLTEMIHYIRHAVKHRRLEKSLRRRDAILEAVSYSAGIFLRTSEMDANSDPGASSHTRFNENINEMLERLGLATHVSRAYIFEKHCSDSGQLFVSQRYEWNSEEAEPQINNPDLHNYAIKKSYAWWLNEFCKGNSIIGHIKDFPVEERRDLEQQGIVSIAVMPVFVGDDAWGFVGFDECRGEREWSEAEIEALHIAAGIIGSAIQQFKTKDAIQKSEENYKSLYSMVRLMCDNVPDMIWSKDPDNNYIFANKATCKKLLGASSTEEPVGKNDMYFAQRERGLHPENKEWHTFGEICSDSDDIVLKSKKPMRFDASGNIQGKFLFLDVYKSLLRNEDGTIIGTVGCGRDVTKEREVEDALRKSELKYRELVEKARSAIVRLDSSGSISFTNEYTEALFGFNEVELIGNKPVGHFFKDSDPAGIKPVDFMGLLRANPDKYLSTEQKCTTKSGNQIWVRWQTQAIRDPEGHVAEYFAIGNDITEKKYLEEQKDLAYAQIEKNFEQMAVISDKIRNPLTAIMMLSSVLENETAEKIIEFSKEINDLIKEIDRGWLECMKVRDFLRKHY